MCFRTKCIGRRWWMVRLPIWFASVRSTLRCVRISRRWLILSGVWRQRLFAMSIQVDCSTYFLSFLLCRLHRKFRRPCRYWRRVFSEFLWPLGESNRRSGTWTKARSWRSALASQSGKEGKTAYFVALDEEFNSRLFWLIRFGSQHKAATEQSFCGAWYFLNKFAVYLH